MPGRERDDRTPPGCTNENCMTDPKRPASHSQQSMRGCSACAIVQTAKGEALSSQQQSDHSVGIGPTCRFSEPLGHGDTQGAIRIKFNHVGLLSSCFAPEHDLVAAGDWVCIWECFLACRCLGLGLAFVLAPRLHFECALSELTICIMKRCEHGMACFQNKLEEEEKLR